MSDLSSKPEAASTLGDLSRRSLILGAPLVLVGCQTAMDSGMYGTVADGRHTLPAMDMSGVDPRFFRQTVSYFGRERPGTIVVHTAQRHLWLVQPGGRALRYGIGVGKEGLAFRGSGVIGRKAVWPNWTPTANMIRRDPRNARYAGGMPGGIANPFGPRALYLHRNGRDTMFRIHGTNEPRSIGQAVSSGCIRLFNHDIIDLYDRARVGTLVTVVG